MKIIDLLNKIANGEKVKIFKYDGYIFVYDIDRKKWKNENGDVLSTYCNVEECLNDEVEILEETPISKLYINNELQYDLEEKKIPEKIPEEIIVGKKQPTHRIKKIEKKINEIIDYLKSKGE